ncbi:MAG TPA: MarR family transcriptional regulator [Cyclobacteriaceae bacterium]|nr:MarR family transcriptional regulator [Cyclobacteriaceae bacterium]
MTTDQKLEDVLYYLLEKTNKVIRRYSQVRFNEAGINITVDQWLVLKKINDSDRITQIELANALFKDRASITRILDLLLEKKLIRKEPGVDKRVHELVLTPAGQKFMEQAFGVVKKVRKKGIETLQDKEQEQLRMSLQKIIRNLE